MKKTHIGRNVRFAAVILCFIAVFTTCRNNIGLGGTIDINPPKIENVYPPIGAVIKNGFTLAVEASDDTSVKSVTVTVTEKESGRALEGASGLFNLTPPKNGEKYWTAEVNAPTAGGFSIKDGSYKIQILVVDSSEKEVRAESAFVIDNTPPLLILNRPSTAAVDADSAEAARDVFGDVFSLVGQVYDESPVAALEITAEGGGARRTKLLKNVPQNIRLTVDSFSADKDEKFYRGLYGNDDKAGKKNYSYTIRVYDSAKEYKTPGNTAANDESFGNSTDIWYLSDDLYDTVLSKYKIHDVYAMLCGTYKGEPSRSADEIKTETNTILSILNDDSIKLGGGQRTGTFALDPSINPRFDMPGTDPVVKPETGRPPFSKLYSGNLLTLKLSRNLDDVPLEAVDTYQFFLLQWDTFDTDFPDAQYPVAFINSDTIYESDGTTLKHGLIKLNKESIEQEGGNYLINIKIIETIPGLSYNKRYVVLVRGKDKNGNMIIPDRKGGGGGLYGFWFAKNERTPEIYLTEINGAAGTEAIQGAPVTEKHFTERAYVKKGAPVAFKLYLTKPADIIYTLKGESPDFTEVKPNTSAGTHEFTIDASHFDQTNGGNYKLAVKAEADGNASVEQTYHIVYDVKGPEVRISYPVGDLSGDEGEALKMSGTAFDAGSGLQLPVTVQLKYENGITENIELAEGKSGENWETKPIDLSGKEGTCTVTVSAADKLAQLSTPVTKTFVYDKAAPVINELKIDGTDISNGATIFNTTGTVTVSGKVVESYGIKTFTINGENAGSSAGAFNKNINLSEGSHTVKIVLIDKADKAMPEIVVPPIVVDTNAPVFKKIRLGEGNPEITHFDADGDIRTSSTTVAINGEFEDTGSGLKQLKAEWTEGSTPKEKLFTPLSQGNGLFTISDSFPLEMGVNEVTFTATDKTGKTAVWKAKITIENHELNLSMAMSNPASPYTKDGKAYVPGNFTLSAKGSYGGDSQLDLEIAVVKGDNTPYADLPSLFYSATLNGANASAVTATAHTISGLKSGKKDMPAADYTYLLTFQPNKNTHEHDGSYIFALKRGTVEKRYVVAVDTTGPAITPVSPQAGGIIMPGGELQAAISDVSDVDISTVTAHYQKAGGAEQELPLSASSSGYKATLPLALAEGAYEIWFSAKDKLGNETNTALSKIAVWYDTDNPAAVLTVKKAGETGFSDSSEVIVKEGFTVKAEGSDTNGVKSIKIRAKKDGTANWVEMQAAASSALEYLINPAAAPFNGADGKYTVQIEVTDNAGKKSYDSCKVTYDKTPPQKPHVNPVAGGFESGGVRWIKSDYIEISGTVSDNPGGSGIEKAEYSVDGGTAWLPVAVVTNATEQTWSGGVSIGTSGIKVRACDKAGNRSAEETVTIKVDTADPELTITAPVDVQYPKTNEPLTVQYTVTDTSPGSGVKNNGVTVEIKSGSVVKKTYTGCSNTETTVPGADIAALGEGTYTVEVFGEDNVGNKSAAQRLPMIVDKTAPNITMVNPVPDSSGWAQDVHLFGKTVISGSFDDGPAGSGMNFDTALYTCTIGKSKSPLLSGDVFKLSGTSIWSIEIANAEQYCKDDTYVLQKYNADNTENPTTGKIYKIPLYISAEDRAGNRAEKPFFIMVDSDGKMPQITIIGPQQEAVPPESSEPSYNGRKVITVGGIVGFSGLAQTNNPAAGSIKKIRVRFSKTEDFSAFTKEFKGTMQNLSVADGVEAVSGANILSWQFTVDADKFLVGEPGGRIDLFYTVQAVNDEGTKGSWTPVRKMILDKNAPYFNDPKIKKGAVETPYENNIGVKEGDILECRLLSVNDISKIEITSETAGASAYLAPVASLSGNTAILGAKIDGQSVFTKISGGAGEPKGYAMALPIKIDSLADPNQILGIKIKLTDNKASDQMMNFTQFNVKYDKTKPAAVFGKAEGKFGRGRFTASGASNIEAAVAGMDIANLYVFVETKDGSAKELKVTGTAHKSISFTAPAGTQFAADSLYILLRKNPIVFDPSSDYQIEGFAYDTGTGVQKVGARISTESVEITGFTGELGNFCSFKQSLKTYGVIDDGEQSLALTVEDKAGNAGDESNTTVFLRNKPLKLSRIFFKTDLNENNGYGNDLSKNLVEIVETASDPNGLNAVRNYEQTVDIVKDFALKNKDKSEIQFTFDGGKGTERKFVLYKDSISDANKISNGVLSSDGALRFKAEDFGTGSGKIEDGDKTLFIVVTDEAVTVDAAGKPIAGDRTRKLTFEVKLKVVITDENEPQVIVMPFYWNSEKDNSIADNDRTQGHIEIAQVSGRTGVSDVSGKAVIRGTAYHTSKISSIDLSIAGNPLANASYSAGVWTCSAGLSVTDTAHDNNGHRVTWAYTWETDAVYGTAEITVKANGKTLASTGSVSQKSGARPSRQSLTLASDSPAPVKGQCIRLVDDERSYTVTVSAVDGDTVEWKTPEVPSDITAYYLYPTDIGADKKPVFNSPKFTVNVVPYITSIENETGEGLSNSVIRGSDGAYSMNYSDPQPQTPPSPPENMIVKGFNLKPASGSTTTAKIGSSTVAVSDVTATSIKVSKKADSGELVVTVGTVESINNKVDVDKPYNQEKDITNPSSNLWNAKRKLVFWENTQVCTSKTDQTFYYPSMVMDGAQPIFAYCNNNTGYTYRTTGDTTSDPKSGIWYARNAVLAKTDDGKYMIVSNEDNFTNGFSGYLYLNSNDQKAKAQIGYDGYSTYYPSGPGLIELCNTSYGNPPKVPDTLSANGWDVPSLNRFKYPNLIVEGNNNSAQIYISYYDSKAKEIRFFAFKKASDTSSNLIEAGSEVTPHTYPKTYYRIAPNGNLVIPGTEGGKSSEHTAMAKVGTGIYIAYQDASSTTLKLAYSTAPIHGNGLANTTAAWATLDVDTGLLTGQYVSMVASGTKLYIAYHDAAKSALKLAVVETNGTVAVSGNVIVDAYQSVGYKTGIAMVNGLPYISYYNNAQAGTKSIVKVAYPKDAAAIGQAGAEVSGAFTGHWIARYIPSISTPNVSVPEFNRVMIDSYSSGAKPVLAWLGDPFIEYTKMR